jgi:hypothetical protein
MSGSNRTKILIPLVSLAAAFALSAHAQEPGAERGAPPHGKPPVQAARPGPGHPPGRGPDARFARGGPLPTRDFGGHAYRGHVAWEGGRWRHEVHGGRDGWWWDVGGVWYYLPAAHGRSAGLYLRRLRG